MTSTFEMGYESGYVAGWDACRKLIRQRYELMLTLGPLSEDWPDAPKRLKPHFNITFSVREKTEASASAGGVGHGRHERVLSGSNTVATAEDGSEAKDHGGVVASGPSDVDVGTEDHPAVRRMLDGASFPPCICGCPAQAHQLGVGFEKCAGCKECVSYTRNNDLAGDASDSAGDGRTQEARSRGTGVGGDEIAGSTPAVAPPLSDYPGTGWPIDLYDLLKPEQKQKLLDDLAEMARSRRVEIGRSLKAFRPSSDSPRHPEDVLEDCARLGKKHDRPSPSLFIAAYCGVCHRLKPIEQFETIPVSYYTDPRLAHVPPDTAPKSYRPEVGS